MRKLLAVCLLFVYTLSSLGVFATTHYCGGNLTHIDFFVHDDGADADKCECAAITKNKCCSDREVKANLKTESTRVLTQHAEGKPVPVVYSYQPVPFIVSQRLSVSATLAEKWSYRIEPPGLRDLATVVIRF